MTAPACRPPVDRVRPRAIARGARMLAIAVPLVLLGALPRTAAADDKQVCVAASEKGQQLRSSGKLVDGWVVERTGASTHGGRLERLAKVVSGEQVLTPEILGLARAVADRIKSLANVQKNASGMLFGLRNNATVGKKQMEEAQFREFAAKSPGPKPPMRGLMPMTSKKSASTPLFMARTPRDASGTRRQNSAASFSVAK